MSAQHPWAPGGVRFLGLLLTASILFALPWTYLGYSETNLEEQGIDIVHHAIFIHQGAQPSSQVTNVGGAHGDYPHTSHALASWATPLFGGDALRGMRFVALVSLLLLGALQYTFLCRVVPPLPAVVLLVGIGLVGQACRVSNLNHFMWQGQYNYSRAVGGVGFWLALVILARETSTRRRFWLVVCLANAAAAFALACHIAPGALAFGALGLFFSVRILTSRCWDDVVALALTIAVAAGMFFGTSVWRYMAHHAGSDGWLPVNWYPVLLAWVPTALVAFLRLRSCSRQEAVLGSALLVAGGLQTYLAARMYYDGSCAPYAVKNIFFYTFPLTALLWVGWLAPWVANLRVPYLRAVLFHPALAVVVLLFATVRLGTRDPGLRRGVPQGTTRQRPARDEVLRRAVARLSDLTPTHGKYYYHDPRQPHGSYFASIAALRLDWGVATFCLEKVRQRQLADLLADPRLEGVLLPREVAPDEVFSVPTHAETVGPFWRVRASGAASQR